MDNNVKGIKAKMNFLSWLTAIFFVFYISGFESAYVNYMVSAGAMGITLAYAIMHRDYFAKGVWRSAEFKLLLIFLMLFFYYMFIYGKSSVKHTMANYIMFMPMVIYLFYEKQPNVMKGVFVCTIITWIFFAVRAYYMYSNELVAARAMASHQVDKNVLTGGGYGFAVGSAMLTVFLIEMILWGNIKKYKFLTWVFVAVLILVVKETYSTITILAMGIGIATAVVFKCFGINTLKHISIKHILLVIFVIASIIIFFMYKEELGRYLIRTFSGAESIVQRRISEIGYFLLGSVDSTKHAADLSGRLNMVESSWSVFFENPVFGVVHKYGNENLARVIGSHGEFTDILAKFGIVGAVPYIAIFINTLIKERRRQKNKIGFGYIVAIVIMAYFNPFLYFQSVTVFFFMIPAITLLFNSEVNEELVLNDPLRR